LNTRKNEQGELRAGTTEAMDFLIHCKNSNKDRIGNSIMSSKEPRRVIKPVRASLEIVGIEQSISGNDTLNRLRCCCQEVMVLDGLFVLGRHNRHKESEELHVEGIRNKGGMEE
jgi:hypothetical protein